jgi:O-antigen/teichoic acid export membrane protein
LTTLSRNVVFNVVGQGLVLVLSFIAVKFLFRQLGADVFGVIYFNITLATVVTTVLELGISSTSVREVSRHFQTEPIYIRSFIQTTSFIYWGLGLLVFVVVFAGAPILVEKWINLTTVDSATASTMVRILGVSTSVVLPRALYTSLFRGRQRMGINNSIDVAAAFAQQLGIVLVLRAGGGVFAVAAWISVSAVAWVLAYVFVAARMFGWSALAPRLHFEVVRRNARFAGLMMSNSLLSLVHSQADKVIVSKLLPIADFGFYGFASATVGRAGFVTAAITQAAFPSLSSLFESGDRPGLLRQYRKLQDLVCFGTLPMFAAICFGAVPAYTYLFNASVAGRLLLPTFFLALGFFLNAAINTPYVVSLAMGKPQIAVRSNVVALFVVLPVTAVLIAVYGITGAAFSWVFYHLFTYVYMVPRVCRECLDMPLWRWYFTVARPLGLAVIAYGLGWFVIAAAGSFSLNALALGYVAATAIYALGSYPLIGADLRDTFVNLRQSLVMRLAGTQ